MSETMTSNKPRIDVSAYFEKRLDDQIDWYDEKSALNKKRYNRLRLIEIIVASMIPLLAGYGQKSEYIGYLIGVFGLIVAIIAGVVSLYRFQENWIEYRAQAESLKQEKFLYLARATPYNTTGAFELLVQRVEALLKQETTSWAQAMRATATEQTESSEIQPGSD